MKLTYVRLGVKFSGICPVCGKLTGDRPFEKAETVLYKSADKFFPVHLRCSGGRLKSKIGGGVAFRTEPKAIIEVDDV